MSIIRRGAQTLSRPEVDVTEMLSWDWPTILEKCKDKPSDNHNSEQTTGNTKLDEEEEKRWLTEMEKVESYVFNGKKYAKGRAGAGESIQQEWDRQERRKGKNTTVMVDGYAVSKESMLCKDWEAVPTLAGKDPRLAEVKREKRAAIENQDVGSAGVGSISHARLWLILLIVLPSLHGWWRDHLLQRLSSLVPLRMSGRKL
jgi:SWI/SNF-related matrix-associated actin-dependent regulator of chromatin subfamily A member 5